MGRVINLVGTHCVDGNQPALERWYADHVHQLFGDAGLLEARLLRLETTLRGGAPEYLCSYDFADAAAFAAYEAGPVKAAAAADRELGWGRDGIAISLRKAYRRLYRREGPQGRATAWRVAAVAEIPAGAAIDWRTWAAAHREGLDLYEALDAKPGPLAVVCVERGTAHDQPPSVVEGPASQAWCGDYRLLWTWSR